MELAIYVVIALSSLWLMKLTLETRDFLCNEHIKRLQDRCHDDQHLSLPGRTERKVFREITTLKNCKPLTAAYIAILMRFSLILNPNYKKLTDTREAAAGRPQNG